MSEQLRFDYDLRVKSTLIEAIARALYDTDEDMVDDSISALTASGDRSWQDGLSPRLSWEQLECSLRKRYFRRARAVAAVFQDMNGQNVATD